MVKRILKKCVNQIFWKIW